MKKRFSILTLILACVLTAALTGLCVFGVFFVKCGGEDSFPYATKFAAVFNAIKNDYVGDVDMDKVSDAAYGAMIGSIDDRWSYYMNPEQYEEYKLYQKNSYTGIGVTIVKDDQSELYRIATVLEDSPASKAGVSIGEIMCAIDGESLAGKTSTEVKDLIASKKDEAFDLTLRAGDGTERTLTIGTELIHSDPVKYEMLDDGIGYIRIKNFETDSGEETIKAVDDLVERGAKGIIFDVRNNPGGFLSELLKALDHILPEGDLFVSANKAGAEKVETSDASCVKLPMTVLIDENSYSAAEFFAAALSEYDWAKLVGTHSTGKARSQINIEMTDGSAVHLSTNSYLTPKRVDLAKTGGLAPDVSVSISDDDGDKLVSGLLEHDKDAQLKAALEEIKALVDK
ncbi:MAG: S41 family peptidase [Firmicutes bacterium HGW-Firmicutes-16]|nr:MAG: S41 family peptidase [Firmicutes bacterium HGW-Firmicutes-16]